jgi:hypothetical protein
MGFVGSLLGNSTGAGYQATGATGNANTIAAENQTQAGIKQQQDFVNQLMTQNGLGNQQNVFNQQQGLANQLQGVANGTGPNPAQAMLNQATGANVSAQNALMAGQRGASNNVGLIARQAAMQGANTQQQAAGQGATMQANQSLNAMGQLQGQQANMAGTAQNQVGNQQAGLNALNNASLQQQGNLLGLQANQNSANAGIAGINAKGQQGIIGGVMNGIGSVFGANGGQVPHYANGTVNVGAAPSVDPTQPQSSFGKFMKSYGAAQSQDQQQDPLQQGTASMVGGIGKALKGAFGSGSPDSGPDASVGTSATSINPTMGAYAKGGKVPAMVSPGEKYLSPDKVDQVAKGASPMAEGETIPGKPKVGGAVNSYQNDTVPKTLEEGGIVIPRHITQGKNPEKAAHKFVSAILAKNGKMLKGSK